MHQTSLLTAGDFQVANVSPIPARSFPTSEAQREIWLHSQLCREANCAFNETITLELSGNLDRSNLELAIKQTVQRHEMLRATFSDDGLTVRVAEQAEFDLQDVDWSALSDSEAERYHVAAIAADGKRPFDLQNGPLLRVRLARLSSKLHYLTITAHHIVMDGWSAFAFARDVGKIYDQLQGLAGHTLANPDLYSQYADAMIRHESSESGRQDAQYWREQFADGVPVLDLPTDRPRGDTRTFTSRRYDHTIQAAKLTIIRKSAAKLGCSLFNFVFLGFHAFLARLTGQDDFSIGVPTAGQASMNFPNLIGHCVNTIPIRTKVDLQATVHSYAKQARPNMLDALEHQRYTFGSLVRDLKPPRDLTRPPIFSVMITIEPELDIQQLGFTGLQVKLRVEPRVYENFEWFISGVIRCDGHLELHCQYNSDLFEHDSIEHYMQCFEAFLLAMAENPQARLADLQMLSIADRQKMCVDWNETGRDYPSETTVFQEILSQALRTPDQVAAVFDGQQLSYEELIQKANRLAHYLQRAGVQQGERVGICMPRSLDMLVSTLAVWQLGAAYVPLDPAYPADRLRMMVDDAQLKRVLAIDKLSEEIVPQSVAVIDLRQSDPAIQSMPTTTIETSLSPRDVAYVIYTSGSTGKPKGVQVPQGSVVNFLYSMREQPGIQASDRLLAITTLSFDISVLELFLPLTVGARVVIADQASVVDGKRLMKLIDQHSINFLQATPSTWRMLLDQGWTGRGDMKALCGGEAFPRDLAKRLLGNCQQVWNMYGPTETTVWSTAFQIKDADAPIYIGRPIANTQLYVLDANLRPVPVGAMGELYIGGAGVTYGYLNRSELTSSRFIDNPYFNPFKDYINHRLYQTGDLVRYRADGNLQYLQRNDKQVKLRGHRIELGEIEYRISELQEIRQVVAVVREDQPNDPRLVAYFVPKDKGGIAPERIRESLHSKLPAYMIPQYFVELANLPQTANGKIDKKQLPPPSGNRITPVLIAAQSESEILLAECWRSVLEVDEVGLHDNFFNLGGHSLLVIQVIAKVEQAKGVRLSPQDFLMGTLQQLASKLDLLQSARLQTEEIQFEQPQSAAKPTTVATGQTEFTSSAGTEALHGSLDEVASEDQIQYLGDASERIFTYYHAAQSQKRGLAVLLAPPIGTEYQRTHWAIRRLTQQLTRSGYPVMRFDYRGTGDSTGETADINSLKNWQADLRAAAGQLRLRSGCQQFVVVGLRLGASLAIQAADTLGIEGLKQIIAWHPVLDGKRYLRSLRQMQAQMLDLWHTPVNTTQTATHEEILGTLYSRNLLSEIESIDLGPGYPQTLQHGIGLHFVSGFSSPKNRQTPADASASRGEDPHWEDLRFLEIAWLPNQQPRQIIQLIKSFSKEAE